MSFCMRHLDSYCERVDSLNVGKVTGRESELGDLGKAYDRVPRHEVLRRKREKEVPDKYGMIVQNMYEGARTRAKTNDRMKSLDPSGRLYAVGQHQGYCIRVGMSMDVLACGIKYLSRGA